MADRLSLEALVGAWDETSRLWLDPRGPGEASAATASVVLVAGGEFASIAYTWSFGGQPQDGLLLVRLSDGPSALGAVWVDSFHTSGGFMTFRDEVDPSGRRSLYGTYAAQEGPAWGWRIALEEDDDADDGFRLAMWNVPPEGMDERAVEARFRRVVGT